MRDKQNEIKYFTKEETKKLFNAITNSNDKYKIRNEAIFKLAYYCALRSSEVGLLTIHDINFIKNEIYCRRLKGSLNNTLEIIDKDVLRSLKRYIRTYNPDNYLFLSRNNKPISRKMLDVLMKKYCFEAEIKDKTKYHFHTLKHSKAVNLAEDGLDLKEIQYWLGHKEITNTQIYFQFTSSQQKELYRKLRNVYK